tara:strand:- start:573 stop:1376 length:804 start_codon:yes stop_codon:yes gene_type:complete
MGIIEQHRKQSRRNLNYAPPTTNKNVDKKNSKILDLTYMKDLIDKVLSHHKTVEKPTKVKNFRKWSYVQSWNLQNLLGHVDTPTFVFMLESFIEWCVDSHSAIQPNGKWELYDWECTVEGIEFVKQQYAGKDSDGRPQTVPIAEEVQKLTLGVRFVDINGKEDLEYEMGRPKASSQKSITPAMLQQILENQGSKVNPSAPSVDTSQYEQKISDQAAQIAEQSGQMQEMKDQMRQMQEMVAGLITELQTTKNSDIVPSKAKTVKKRGK